MSGIPGVQGPFGRDGQAGRDGLPGLPGVQGPKGEVGPQGQDGSQGNDGPMGPKGDEGPQGQVGLPGNDGLKGAHGLQGFPGHQGPAVVFAAIRKSRSITSADSDISYDELIVNKGSGMTAGSGTFVAPQGGVYFFTASAETLNGQSHTTIYVMKNGAIEQEFEDYARETATHTNLSHQWMFRLDRGDSVKLRLNKGGLAVSSIDKLHFTGQLVAD